MEAADLGYIRKVTVRHDNSNLGADWYLDRIEVVDETEPGKRKYIFICERWLAKKKDDGKLKRTLYEKNYEVLQLLFGVGLHLSFDDLIDDYVDGIDDDSAVSLAIQINASFFFPFLF